MSPFTTFRGSLKQLQIDEEETGEPARGNAFRWAFPAFLNPLIEYELGSPDLLPFEKVRARRRRYSRGLFSRAAPLPRSRYSTVCMSQNGFDAGGLCQELKAYAGSILRQRVALLDEIRWPDELWPAEQHRPSHPHITVIFHDPDGDIAARLLSDGVGSAISIYPSGFGITLGCAVRYEEIDRVVDLRVPDTQEWFLDTFQRGFGGLWWKNGEDISRFEEMLPALYVSDLGGSQTTHAIGYCLRSMGAAALIYPSARCNAETVIEDGMLRSWYGFNLVDFRGSGASDQEAGSQVKQECFEDQAAWNVPMWESMRLEIADISDDRDLARRFKGSWRVRGVEEAHQRHFEAGGVLGGREGGEWEEVGVDTTGEFIRGLRAALNDRSE